MDQQDLTLVTLTGELVAAYVENNEVATTDLPSFIQTVHAALLSRRCRHATKLLNSLSRRLQSRSPSLRTSSFALKMAKSSNL